jgi:hypothetical protein
MTWLGTRFTIVLGGIRLRVRIVLEDVPEGTCARPPNPAV